MKKVFKFAAIAIVALGLTVACKSNTEEPADTTLPEVEEIIDTTPLEEVAEEMTEEANEPVKVAKTDKKEEAKPALTTGDKNATVDEKAVDRKVGNRQIKKQADEKGMKAADETAKPATVGAEATEGRLRKRN